MRLTTNEHCSHLRTRSAQHPTFCDVQPAFLTGFRREAGEEAVYARLATEVPGDVLVEYFEETNGA